MGAKKKLVARISKSEPLILKSKPLIFSPLKTRSKNVAKMQTKRHCFRLGTCIPVAGRLPHGVKPKAVVGLRQSRAGIQMTAEVRKLAKGPHLTLLLNFPNDRFG